MTPAQRRLLKRMLSAPGSAVSIETREASSPHEAPTFHGHFHGPACPTCRHAKTEPINWRPIFALVEAGALKERLRGTDYYLAEDIPASVRAALADPPA